jgi:hypothetical protein
MKIRRLIVVVLFMLLAGSAFAATAPGAPLSVKQFGSAQIDYAKDLATDASGNVYVAGTTHGAIDVATTLASNTNKGGTDAFVAKFDPQGELLWVVQFGSAADDFIEGITLDKYGFLYVAGWTMGSMPGGVEQPVAPRENANAGRADVFVAKIHTGGTLRWIKQFGTNKDDFAYGVTADRSGLVYVVGSTSGTIDGATDPGTYSDAFLMQLDANGNKIRVTQFNVASSPLDTYAYGVAVDSSTSSDYIFVTGLARAYENGSLFIAKFNAWCELKTLVTAGGPRNGSDNDIGRAIAVDSKGNVIVAGSTLGAFDRNAWSGNEDIIVVKYTTNLSKLWSYQYGTTTNDAAYGVAVDAEDNIYLTGITGYPGGPGLDGQTYLGASDIFLTRFSPEGRKLFTRQVGTASQDCRRPLGRHLPCRRHRGRDGGSGFRQHRRRPDQVRQGRSRAAPRDGVLHQRHREGAPLRLRAGECQHYREGRARKRCWRIPHGLVREIPREGFQGGQVFHPQTQDRLHGPGGPRRCRGNRGSPDGDSGFQHAKNRRQDGYVLPQGLQHRPVHDAARR